MMVTFVRGHFKDVHGTLEFDPAHPERAHVSVTIDARGLWSGEKDRDAHLKSADFLDVEHYPTIRYEGDRVEVRGASFFVVQGKLTLRGITRDVPLRVSYLGQWDTPWWEGNVNKGPKRRAGFVAKAEIERQDFGVLWNSKIEGGGLVVGNTVDITIDAEAVLTGDSP